MGLRAQWFWRAVVGYAAVMQLVVFHSDSLEEAEIAVGRVADFAMVVRVVL